MCSTPETTATPSSGQPMSPGCWAMIAMPTGSSRTAELIGEDERVAVSAHGLGCGVPESVGEAGGEHQPESSEGQIFMTTVFVCVYSSKASIDFSRPYPDFLKPPKGSSTPPPAP